MAYNILAFRRPVALLLLVCIFYARHATYLGTCAASFSFCCDPLRALRRRRIPYVKGLHCLVVYLWYISTVVRFVTYLFSPCLPLTALCLFRWFLALRGT